MTAPTYADYTSHVAALNLLGQAPEVTPGTYVAPTVARPVTKLDFSTVIPLIESKTYQGDLVGVHAVTPGVKDGKGSFTAEPNINEIGFDLGGILNVLGESGSAPTTHFFGVNSAVRPTSWSFTNAQGPGVKQYAGAYYEEVALTADEGKLISVDSKIQGLPGYVSSAFSPSWDASAKIPFWASTLKIGDDAGTAVTVYVKKSKWTIKRTTKPEHPGTGTQVASGMYSGLVTVDFEATITVNASDTTELDVFESGLGTPRYVGNQFAPADTSGDLLLVEALALKYDSVVIKQDNLDGTVDLDVKGKCVGAPTTLDGPSGYLSPIQVTLTNGTASGAYGVSA